MDKEKPFLVPEFNTLMDWSAWKCSKMDGTFRDIVHRAVPVVTGALLLLLHNWQSLFSYKSCAGMGIMVFTGSENWAPFPFS